jgi:cellulose synthase/poly-beta-1,6-N-acetylglucosamine synthase-like glycosyltransferase
MLTPALTVLGAAILLPAYAYIGYPLLLRLLAALKPDPTTPNPPATWPSVSIVLAAYNEEDQLPDTLASLLALDYPEDRRQILVISDASTDRTDTIVTALAHRGVELLRMPRRVGKSAAENAALSHLRGDIIVNTDASIRIHPAALKELVTWLEDPGVGVVSGRDVSVADGRSELGEGGYVGFEMRLRRLETRIAGIVGASGCLYAIRTTLHRVHVPEGLSRDFMAVLTARERGLRAVSADRALCFVPQAGSLRHEYRRKVRTLVRGMQTLAYKRQLLNPFRYGVFAWMLFSHKISRWMAPWSAALAVAALAVLAPNRSWAAVALALVTLGLAAALLAWTWPPAHRLPRWLGVAGYLVFGNLAACGAAVRALRGRGAPIWEPTRRPTMRRAGLV